MSTSRLHRLILAVYPERFRDRYGNELAALAAVCFLLLASTTAATSSVRGLRAARTGPDA
jgi:hypothetical protein